MHTSANDWRAAAALLGEAAAAESTDALTEAILPRMRRLLGGDLAGWDLYDRRKTFLGYKTDPDLGSIGPRIVEPYRVHFRELPTDIIWERGVQRGVICVLSDYLPIRKMLRLGIWNEVFIHQNGKYQISFAGRIDTEHVWVAYCKRLMSDFDSRERELGRFLQTGLSRVTPAVVRRERARRTAGILEGFFRQHEAMFALVTPAGRIVEISPPARALLARAVPGGMPAPDRLPETCADLRAVLHRILESGGGAPRLFATTRIGPKVGALVVWLAHVKIALVIFEDAPPGTVGDQRAQLTRREAEVLSWLSEGKSNAEIGLLLRISPRTVEEHCTSLFAKLGVETRFAAALMARR